MAPQEQGQEAGARAHHQQLQQGRHAHATRGSRRRSFRDARSEVAADALGRRSVDVDATLFSSAPLPRNQKPAPKLHKHRSAILQPRSAARMAHPPADRRLRSPPSSRSDCGDHHRFLRPGALARLCDSKIVARSLRSSANARLLPPSSPPPRSPARLAPAEGGVPHFYFGGTARGPRYPLRKKFAAARGVVFLPTPPMSPGAAEAFLGAFALAPSELLAAH